MAVIAHPAWRSLWRFYILSDQRPILEGTDSSLRQLCLESGRFSSLFQEARKVFLKISIQSDSNFEILEEQTLRYFRSCTCNTPTLIPAYGVMEQIVASFVCWVIEIPYFLWDMDRNHPICSWNVCFPSYSKLIVTVGQEIIDPYLQIP